ncbi:RICIN domain-containing protein [Streptomyces violascens]|uniref:RICIN domain-containing protein n=1 Tax=Streptomyces violascens TaxID=67381 RepID=UPI0036C6D93A
MLRTRGTSSVITAIAGLALTVGVSTPAAAKEPYGGNLPYYNLATGTCLDWSEGTNRVGLWHCNGGDNQKWEAVNTSDNTYKFVNKASNTCLDWSSDTNRVGVWHCNGGDNQSWYTDEAVSPKSWMMMNKASMTCLDWSTGSNRLGLWNCNGGNNQRWVIAI